MSAEMMMRLPRPCRILGAVPLLCSGALLLACSSPVPWTDAAPDRAASAAAAAAADFSYLQGRSLYLAHRRAEAIAAYEAALRLDATHVGARNGLAVAYAEQREFAPAIAIWRALTDGATLASGDTAYLFANLGYAYMLDGDLEAARVALEKACLLDPLNGRAWQYLGETLVKLGQDERGRAMLRQADALRSHDFRADYAAADHGQRLPAIERALSRDAQPDREWAVVEVTRRDDGILELRRVPASGPAAHPAPVPVTLSAPAAPGVVLLEISNGNGRQGLARRLARQLRDPGIRVVRLTNETGFDVRATRIEYRPAFRADAERLALRIGAGTPVEAGAQGRVDVRVVIGHDMPGDASGPAQAALAQANPAR
jgi:tetratricopeptide (TPR) repeat protein